MLRFLDDPSPGKTIDLEQGDWIPDAILKVQVSALDSRLA
jgi:hypothetical protein